MENQNKSKFFLWLGILIGAATTIFLILYKLSNNNKSISTIINKYIKIPCDGKQSEQVGFETEIVKPKPVKNNLKAIKGIGPAIETLLNENMIFSFSELSTTSVADLQRMLEGKNLRLANPETWPDQAKQLME